MYRNIINYDIETKLSIKRKLDILILQIKDKSEDGINTIWKNQDKCGEEICKVFNNKSVVNCLVYGKTQTGKTGCMTAVIYHLCLSNLIPIDNIYIITGLSDKEWKKDTKTRMPDSINKRVFHRSNLPKTFINDIRSKKNLLIIMDEIQIACKDEQTIQKIFKECGFYDLDYILQNDIKLIQFSATPDGNINDISDWKNHSSKVKLESGDGYYGSKQAINQNRVRQFKCLTNINNVKELKQLILEKYLEPMYHLIRVPNKRDNKQETVISNFNTVFNKMCEYNTSYLEIKKDDINNLLNKKPKKHTFIFYCEILRCAKTQFKKFIGISYERYVVEPNDSSIIQGSFGRLTGYDDNGFSICYTNIDSLKNYDKLWENNMEFIKGIKWNTKTTNWDSKDNLSYSSGTFNSVTNIEQLKNNCSNKIKNKRGDPIIKRFNGEDGQNKMIDWFNKNLKSKLKKRGPNKKKTKDGFYKGSIRNGLEILSKKKVENEQRWGFSDSINYRAYPCYSDITNPNTLEWWLLYYL